MMRWSPASRKVAKDDVVLPVVWREQAAEQLDAIIDHIAQFDEAAADRLEALALYCAERLAHFPYMYRAGRVHGTREAVVHPNYILIYRVGAEQVEILSVVHSRRQYPPG